MSNTSRQTLLLNSYLKGYVGSYVPEILQNEIHTMTENLAAFALGRYHDKEGMKPILNESDLEKTIHLPT